MSAFVPKIVHKTFFLAFEKIPNMPHIEHIPKHPKSVIWMLWSETIFQNQTRLILKANSTSANMKKISVYFLSITMSLLNIKYRENITYGKYWPKNLYSLASFVYT